MIAHPFRKTIFYGMYVIIMIIVSILVLEFAAYLLGVQRYQTWLEMDKKGYIKNQTNTKAWGQTFDEPIYYSFDDVGARITSADSIKKNASRKVLILGDSFAFGLYLHDSLTITHQLNELSGDSLHFINGGVGGSGTADHYWHLNYHFKNRTFSDVILLMNTDDVDRMIGKNLFVWKKDSLIQSQRWKPTGWYQAIRFKSWHTALERNSHLYALFSKYAWKHLFFYDDFEVDESERAFIWPPTQALSDLKTYPVTVWTELIKAMKKEAEVHGASFHLVTTGYPADSTNSPRTFTVYKRLSVLCDSLQVNFLDIREAMNDAAQGDMKNMQLWPDTHPNGKGTRVISNTIWQEIFKKDN